MAAVETQPTLPETAFIGAEWLDDKNGYATELPERGDTILYPLRRSCYGPIPPHIYQERMFRLMQADKFDPLTSLHVTVSNVHELNGKCDDDLATQSFHTIQNVLDDLPIDFQQPELSEKLQEVFYGYVAGRHARRNYSAEKLSELIGKHELYVVASDHRESRLQANERPFYVARLFEIVNIRDGDNMHYDILARDTDGNVGLLPPAFGVPQGVSAPARPDAA